MQNKMPQSWHIVLWNPWESESFAVNSESPPHRFGFVTVFGPPNVGKSTLVNRLTQSKVSIVSRHPQTTRHRIMGIRTFPDSQIVFVDTPGLHFNQQKALNRQINQTAKASLHGIDLIIFMIVHGGWTPGAKRAFHPVASRKAPVILLINKIDQLRKKSTLLPLIDESRHIHEFQAIIPLSARKDDLDRFLLPTLISQLPVGPAGFSSDQISDRGPGFRASEFLREQIFALFGDELPYESAVELTKFDRSDPKHWQLEMIVWVEREGQKRIIIGQEGKALKTIGQRARKMMEHQFGVRVRLDIWVKKRERWRDNLAMLRSLGYTDE